MNANDRYINTIQRVLTFEKYEKDSLGKINPAYSSKVINKSSLRGIGYDIESAEVVGTHLGGTKYIEVKTTISSKPLHFNRIHLTKNEWNTASSTHDRYFVYRLMLSKNERKLFILQDPVGLYKNDEIDMVPSDGADITFNPSKVGYFEELLTWKA